MPRGLKSQVLIQERDHLKNKPVICGRVLQQLSDQMTSLKEDLLKIKWWKTK